MLPTADFGRWWAALLFGLMLALLLLIAAWLLRVFVPVAPTINLSAVQMPAAFAATRPLSLQPDTDPASA